MESDFKRLLFELSGRIQALEERQKVLQVQIPRQDREMKLLRQELAEMKGYMEGLRVQLGSVVERLGNLEDSG